MLDNGKLRHSLATLEGEQDFKFVYRALLSFLAHPSLPPSLFSCLQFPYLLNIPI